MDSALFARREDMRKVILDSGATLLSLRVPDALSTAVGVWVKRGSRDEDAGRFGITHFIEHMVFKGTARRSALEIALAVDRLGGQLDAFTTKEVTCFNARVLAEHFEIALDVLADMLVRPSLDPEMVELEKQVVVEEIRNVLDDPEDWIHEMASEELFDGHPLGRPILGSEASVTAFRRDDLLDQMRRYYGAGNVLIAVAGPLDHDAVRAGVERHFTLPAGGPDARRAAQPTPPVARRVRLVPKDLNQQHLWIGRLGLSLEHPDRYGLLLLSTLLGGSMSSRLFQAIREQSGLAYSVFSFSDFASDAGVLGTYMAVSPQRGGEAVRRTLEEFALLTDKGCPESELEDTKMQLKGSLLLAMESVSARMTRLARNEINEGRFIGVQELVARIDAVTGEDVQRLARDYLDPARLTLVSLGPQPEAVSF